MRDRQKPTSDDCIALVVEGTAEDLVGVSLQDLFTLAGVWVPETGRLVSAGGHHKSTLRVEGYLGTQREYLVTT